ncbi:retrovirus-related Pol polyprotein from transposon 17.6 [Trichonephila clavipes]|nr:retrovirus-related Pol polyprotein from transposon 17.6 [Trichonephila clavipes]
MEKAAESASFNCCSETKGLWRLLQQEEVSSSYTCSWGHFEGDHEFGEIHPTPNLSRSTSERVLHEINLNHLKESEREQVLAIVLKHQTQFTSDVKIAKVGTHRIRLKPNIERKKPFVYRIPESLKIKVDEQIEELVRLDLIEESDAEIAYQLFALTRKMVPYDFALTSEL